MQYQIFTLFKARLRSSRALINVNQNRHNPCGAMPFSLVVIANRILTIRDPPVLVFIAYLGEDGLGVAGVIVVL
jgi:hypothetical protein